jgi:deoxyribose-phosphate aldolase
MNTGTQPPIELTLLAPDTTIEAVDDLCTEALKNNYTAVCVPPLFVKKVKALLQHSNIKVATVIGFPFGFNVVEAKLAEIIMAMVDGADELNVAVNMTALTNNDWQYLARELNTILPVIRKQEKQIKIVVEAHLLSPDTLIKCCDLYGIAGVNFMSLSTGFKEHLPTIDIVDLVRKHLADQVEMMLSANFLNDQERDLYTSKGVSRLGAGFIVK